MYNSSFYPVVLSVSGQPNIGLDSLNISFPSFESGSSRNQHGVRQAVFSDTLKLLFAKDSVRQSVFESLQMAAEELNNGGVNFFVICRASLRESFGHIAEFKIFIFYIVL